MGGRVELRGLVRRYGASPSSGGGVGPVDLDVAPGELLALVGPSGSGKSTLLRLLAGLEAPDAGTIAIDGNDVTRRPPHERDVGVTFDDGALYEHLTVRGNIEAALDRKRVRGAAALEAAKAALRLVRGEALIDRKPASLSAGERRRAALARAFAPRPALLLLDEPLTHLDRASRLDLREDLRHAQQEIGATTIVVTHDHDDAIALADRVAYLSAGRVRHVGAASELIARPLHVDVAIGFGTAPMNVVAVEAGSIGFRADAAVVDGAAGTDAWSARGVIGSMHGGLTVITLDGGRRVRVPTRPASDRVGAAVRIGVAAADLHRFAHDGTRLD
ncbi:MAG: ABC transporter ATP-binding protein [Phycisphaerales bacterium]